MGGLWSEGHGSRSLAKVGLWITMTVSSLTSHPVQAAASVETVLRHFHTEEYLRDAWAYFADALKRHEKDDGINPDKLQKFSQLSQRIYLSKNLFPIFTTAYAKVITPTDLAEISTWQKTPTGLLLARSYRIYYDTPARQKDLYYRYELGRVLKFNRKNALRTFAIALELNELQATFHTGAEIGVLLGLEIYRPVSEREKDAKIIERAEAYRQAYLALDESPFLRRNFITMKDVRNEDIDRFSKFFISIAGQAHTKAFGKALMATLKAAAMTLKDQLSKDLKGP